MLEKSINWSLEEVLNDFHRVLKEKKNIFIYGCGPSLEITVNNILDKFSQNSLSKVINLAADGATRFLKTHRIPVQAVFTDLDGIEAEDFYYPQFVIVHAHGDNINKILNYKRQIIEKKNIIATTQVEPDDYVLNPGGFTDGDRILYFIKSLINPKQRIYLIGMDFESVIGKFSKPWLNENIPADTTKLKKLRYGHVLVEWIAKMIKNDIFLVNSGISIKNTKSISLQQINFSDY